MSNCSFLVGPIGLVCLMAAKAYGATSITVIGKSYFSPDHNRAASYTEAPVA